jgi:hypothetical protein
MKVREGNAKKKASCLGKSELQREGMGPRKLIVRASDQRGVASTS